MKWHDGQDTQSIAISVIVLGEARLGVIALDPGPKRVSLERWLAQVAVSFGARILPVDKRVADAWAQVTLGHRRALRTVGAADELIAATAVAHDLVLITRNLRDFAHSGCRLLSPWA